MLSYGSLVDVSAVVCEVLWLLWFSNPGSECFRMNFPNILHSIFGKWFYQKLRIFKERFKRPSTQPDLSTRNPSQLRMINASREDIKKVLATCPSNYIRRKLCWLRQHFPLEPKMKSWFFENFACLKFQVSQKVADKSPNVFRVFCSPKFSLSDSILNFQWIPITLSLFEKQTFKK